VGGLETALELGRLAAHKAGQINATFGALSGVERFGFCLTSWRVEIRHQLGLAMSGHEHQSALFIQVAGVLLGLRFLSRVINRVCPRQHGLKETREQVAPTA